jgi:PAS domain S-box-containing protein
MSTTEPEDPSEPFGLEELFFSTTDERGFIESSNDVFVRVSRYQAAELLGQPHNIIRHPDMPRIVFRELWDHLEDGRGIGAYVVNQAKDGTPYWVYAVARPIPGGYLSVRLKPTTPLFDVVAGLYQELKAVELAIEDRGGRRSEAMDASAEVLGRRLKEAGFPDYDAFMQVATVAEVTARRSAIGRADDGTGRPGAAELAAFLDRQLGLVEAYLGLNQQLRERSSSLIALTKEASLLGFNVTVAASRLGSDGAPLRALAGLLQETGTDLVGRAGALANCLDSTRSTLEHVGFSVAVASLQNDISMLLTSEDGTDPTRARRNIDLMTDCLRRDLDAVFESLRAIETNLVKADDLAQDLVRNLRTLDAVIRNGQVEATRTSGAEFFVALFERAQDLVLSGLEDARSIANAVHHFEFGDTDIDPSRLIWNLEPDQLVETGDRTSCPVGTPEPARSR